jgi:hypothetical protein
MTTFPSATQSRQRRASKRHDQTGERAKPFCERAFGPLPRLLPPPTGVPQPVAAALATQAAHRRRCHEFVHAHVRTLAHRSLVDRSLRRFEAFGKHRPTDVLACAPAPTRVALAAPEPGTRSRSDPPCRTAAHCPRGHDGAHCCSTQPRQCSRSHCNLHATCQRCCFASSMPCCMPHACRCRCRHLRREERTAATPHAPLPFASVSSACVYASTACS